jgi:hypothetical protein
VRIMPNDDGMTLCLLCRKGSRRSETLYCGKRRGVYKKQKHAPDGRQHKQS